MQKKNKNRNQMLKIQQNCNLSQQSMLLLSNPLLIPNNSMTLSKQNWKDINKNFNTYTQKFYYKNPEHSIYVHRKYYTSQQIIQKQIERPKAQLHKFTQSNLKRNVTDRNPTLKMNIPICGRQITQIDKPSYQKMYTLKERLKLIYERKQQNLLKRKQSNLNHTTKSIYVSKLKSKMGKGNLSQTLVKFRNLKTNIQKQKKAVELTIQHDEKLKTIISGHFRKWSTQSPDQLN